MLAKIYEECGVSAVSVLTDEKYFQGKLGDIKAAKDSTTIPVLRKDFIIDSAQVYESRINGADAILLIARVLSDEELADLLALTRKLHMEALVEVRDEGELTRALEAGADLIGVNNRDLRSLRVDPSASEGLVPQIPASVTSVVESGIRTNSDVRKAGDLGASGVLVGTTLVTAPDPEAKLRELLGRATP